MRSSQRCHLPTGPSGMSHASSVEDLSASQALTGSRALKSTCTSKRNIVDDRYKQIVDQAREAAGYGSMKGAFPEEWGSQLLLHSETTVDGTAVIICVPGFLRTISDDTTQLDRAFRFLICKMDTVAMRAKGKYIFVICYLGVFVPWPPPEIAQRITLAAEILPRRYQKNLKHMYILHPNPPFRLCLYSMSSTLCPKAWEKLEYVNTLDELCQLIHPGDKEDDKDRRDELLRKFPFVVHRRDAELLGETPPAMFGMPLKKACRNFGVNHVDRTTGKKYPRLPFPVVFLCERMEREETEVDFGSMFSAPPASMYSLVDAIDTGCPLEADIPGEAMWGVLKLYLDCLPQPLLTYKALDLFYEKGVRIDDTQGKLKFMIDLLNETLSEEVADVILYLVSFWHTMCNSENLTPPENGGAGLPKRSSGASLDASQAVEGLTPENLAKIFAPCFLRTKDESLDVDVARISAALLVTLVERAEDETLWPSRHRNNDDMGSLYSDIDGGANVNDGEGSEGLARR